MQPRGRAMWWDGSSTQAITWGCAKDGTLHRLYPIGLSILEGDESVNQSCRQAVAQHKILVRKYGVGAFEQWLGDRWRGPELTVFVIQWRTKMYDPARPVGRIHNDRDLLQCQAAAAERRRTSFPYPYSGIRVLMIKVASNAKMC